MNWEHKTDEFQLNISGGQEPYDISWEIFDATSPVITPVSSTLSGTTNQINSPWRPLDGSYPGLSNFDGFTTLNDLPAGLYRYTIRSGILVQILLIHHLII